MKYLPLNFLILSLSISGYSQSNLEEIGLLGKVKSSREKVFIIDDRSGRLRKLNCKWMYFQNLIKKEIELKINIQL